MKAILIVKTIIVTASLALFASGCATSQAKLAEQAKITRAQAEQIALAQVPGGKIAEAGLEKENQKLIWSFDIATPGTKDITEIQVDALTGKIVSRETETPAQQAEEARKDKKK